MLIKDYESIKTKNELQIVFRKKISNNNTYSIILYHTSYPEQKKYFKNVPYGEAYYIYNFVIDKELSKLSENEIDTLFSIYYWTNEKERNLLKMLRELKSYIY